MENSSWWKKIKGAYQLLKFTPKFRGEVFKGGYEKIAKSEYKKAMTEAMNVLETEVAKNTPVGVGGTLRAGVRGQVITHLRGEVGIEGGGAKYGEIIEVGRNPGPISREGMKSLELWVKRVINPAVLARSIKTRRATRQLKGKKADRALASTTFVVGRKIREEGFEGKFMFRDAEKKLKKRVINMFNTAVKRIERRLSK